MSRPTDTLAWCDLYGCDWRDGAAGARGRAAQHHDRTGHRVIAQTVYGPAAPTQAEELDLYPGDPDPRIERTL